MHLAIDSSTHEIVSGEMSMDWVHDSKVLPQLLNSLRWQISQVSADGVYDTRDCDEVTGRKNAQPAIPHRSNAALWEDEYPRNSATVALHNNSIEDWKVDNNYHKRSLAETAMYNWKQLIGEKLSFRNYNAQAGEVYAILKSSINSQGLVCPRKKLVLEGVKVITC